MNQIFFVDIDNNFHNNLTVNNDDLIIEIIIRSARRKLLLERIICTIVTYEASVVLMSKNPVRFVVV